MTPMLTGTSARRRVPSPRRATVPGWGQCCPFRIDKISFPNGAVVPAPAQCEAERARGAARVDRVEFGVTDGA